MFTSWLCPLQVSTYTQEKSAVDLTQSYRQWQDISDTKLGDCPCFLPPGSSTSPVNNGDSDQPHFETNWYRYVVLELFCTTVSLCRMRPCIVHWTGRSTSSLGALLAIGSYIHGSTTASDADLSGSSAKPYFRCQKKSRRFPRRWNLRRSSRVSFSTVLGHTCMHTVQPMMQTLTTPQSWTKLAGSKKAKIF